MTARHHSTHAQNSQYDPKERRKQQNRIAQRKYRGRIATQKEQTEKLARLGQMTLADALENKSLTGCTQCNHCWELAMSSGSLPPTTPTTPISSPLSHDLSQTGSTCIGENFTLPPSETVVDEVQSISTETSLSLVTFSKNETTNCTFAVDSMDIEGSFLSDPAGNLPKVPRDVCVAMDSTIGHEPSQTNGSTACGDPTESPFPLQDSSTKDYEGFQADISRNSRCTTSYGGPAGMNLHHTQPAVHLAARKGKKAIIAILLQSGAQVDAYDERGRTALHYCVEHGHLEAAELLLAWGADPMIVDGEGATVLLIAIEAGEEKMVELLMEKGLDPNILV